MDDRESDFKEIEEKYTKVDIKPWHFLKIIDVRTPVYLWCNIHIFYDTDNGVFHITNEVNFIPKIIVMIILPFVLMMSLFRKDMDPKVELRDLRNSIFNRGTMDHYIISADDLMYDKDIYTELIKILTKKHPELVI